MNRSTLPLLALTLCLLFALSAHAETRGGITDATLIRTLEGHSGAVATLAFSPGGETLATGSADKTAKLWEVSTGKLIKTLEGHSSFVLTLAFSPDGETLATGSGDDTAKLWELH